MKQIAPWTRRIIVINVLIAVIGYLFLGANRPNPFQTYGALRISDLLAGDVWQLFTYMWIHADSLVIHIIFNMMTLYFVGRAVEYRLGGKNFLWLYICGGLASVGLFLVDAGIRGFLLQQSVNLDQGLVGASGAVCAVMGVFSLMVPDAKVYIMFMPWPIRAINAIKGFAIFSLIAAVLGWVPAVVNSPSVGWFFSIAHSAHLGGILFGWWFYHQAVANAEAPYTPYRSVPHDDEISAAEDESERMTPMEVREALTPILNKISSQGIESLTERERNILELGRRLFG
jgi:membrane associated rhomboid family serine protease